MVKKKCYIYTRVSTAAQTDGYSLEAQEESLRQFADFKELEIVRTYCDAGKSGKSIKGRTEFQRMLNDIINEKDKISFVLVYKLSRFGRNAADVMKSLQILLDYDVDLVSVEDAIDSSTQGGRFTLTILSAVAEIERENITAQFNAARMQKLQEGGWPGGKIPFGYRGGKETAVQEPEEAGIVKLIYELYLKEEFGLATVARYLNEQGYERYSKGEQNLFTRDFIKTIIDNPFYCGKILYYRRTNKKEASYQRPDVIEVGGQHEPIVSEEVWKKAQEKRKERYRRCEQTDQKGRISLLSGLVKCPVCGTGMITRKNKTANKIRGGHYKATYYYGCGKSLKQKGSRCDFRHTYKQDKVDKAVEEIISGISMTPSFEEVLNSQFGKSDNMEQLENQIKNLRKQYYHQEQQKDKFGQMLDNLDVFSEDYEDEFECIENQMESTYDKMEQLESEIADLEKQIETAEKKKESMVYLKKIVTDLPALMNKMTDEEKKEAYRCFIKKIEVYPEPREDGRIIKSVLCYFPLYYGEQKTKRIVESEDSVLFKIETEELEITKAEAKATYVQLKKYVLEKYDMKVSSLYIAQIKRKYGIEVGQNYNLSKSENKKILICPKQKEIAIVDALKHYKMLPESTRITD